jgi:hypothetical protein
MQLQRNAQLAYNKGTLYLALKATQAALTNSIRHALKAFNVPWTTLREQRNGTLAQRNSKPNSKNLSKLEEEATVARILKLDAQGIGATKTIVAEIANNLLTARCKGPVSVY